MQIDNDIHEEIKGTLNYGNVCQYSVQIFSSFVPLFKNENIEIKIVYIASYGQGSFFLHLNLTT